MISIVSIIALLIFAIIIGLICGAIWTMLGIVLKERKAKQNYKNKKYLKIKEKY